VGHRSASDSSQQVVLRRAKRISDVRCAKRLSSFTIKYRIIQVVQSIFNWVERVETSTCSTPTTDPSKSSASTATNDTSQVADSGINQLAWHPPLRASKSVRTDFVASTSLRYKKSQQRIYLYTPRSHCQDKAQPKRIHHEDPLRSIAPPCRITSDDVVGFRFRFKDRRLSLA
jgi:hypothetical protein